MEMEARRAFAASQQELWDALCDPQILKASIPGCERVEVVAAGTYELDLTLKIGQGSPRFQARLQLGERQEPERYEVHFEGDGGVAGQGKGVGRARLIPLADYAPGHPRCQLHYSVSTELAGNIALLDSRLVDGAAQGLAEHFFRRFDEQLRRRYPRSTPSEMRTPPQDMDAAERAGAPTMLLGGSARANTPKAAASAAPGARASTSLWPWIAAGLVVVAAVAAYWLLR